jgi:Na+-driven multidrug efflux pump
VRRRCAAVTASVFWVWLGIAVAEMVSIGLTAVAARRHGERHPDAAARVAGDALLLTLASASRRPSPGGRGCAGCSAS